MNKNYADAQAIYKTTKLIYYAIIIGLVLFAAVAFYILEKDFFFETDLSDTFLIPALILTCTALPFGLFVAKSAINKIQPKESLGGKLHL